MGGGHPRDEAALAVLLTLQTVILAVLFAGVPPHPPQQIAPFLLVSLATAVTALALGPAATGPGEG